MQADRDQDLIKGIVDAMCALPQWQFLESLMAEKEAEGQTDQLMPGSGGSTDSVGDVYALDRDLPPVPQQYARERPQYHSARESAIYRTLAGIK